MIPPFAIEGGLTLAMSRAASVTGLVLASGTLFYLVALRPQGLAATETARLRRLGFIGLLAACGGALAWLLAQTLDLAGSVYPGDVWSVLSGTSFGHLLAARLVLLVAAAAALHRRAGAFAAVLGGAALVLQAGHSHALAMNGPWWLVGSSGLHVLAAGLWLGGLPALWIVLSRAPPAMAHAAARRFSAAGVVCVAVLLATAAVQFDWLVTDVPGLVGTAYGWMVGCKMLLFAALIALAARNRFRLTPALGGGAAMPAIRLLRRAVIVEMALGVAVLMAAGVLTELEPAVHSQKLWPFGWLPSLEAAQEDPDILREVLLAGVALMAGLLAAGAGIWVARGRRMAGLAVVGAGMVAVALSLPHVSPLLVPAVPTVFYRSPNGFTMVSVAAGAALYPAHCAVCHGAQGRGDGPAARGLRVPPADLTAGHLWMHRDGELFWWLTHGMAGPDGALVMPGFAGLDEDARWSLIDFIHARNAGLTLGSGGVWAIAVQAPDVAVACADGAERLSALRGRVVRLVLTGDEVAARPGVMTVLVRRGARSAGVCRVVDEGIAAAYAVVAPGAGAVLIDANGWLRRAAPDAASLSTDLGGGALPEARPAMDMKM